MNPTWSYALTAMGVTGMLLAADRPRVGWWLNLGSQGIWAWYAVTTHQWGFLAAAACYSVAYLRLLRRAFTRPGPAAP